MRQNPTAYDKSSVTWIQQAFRTPILKESEERQLVKLWQKNQDFRSRATLLQSYLRLVIKLAKGFKGYNSEIEDLIAEGNLGLVRALETFDLKRELRFSTYAKWWIRAAMYEHILRFSTPVTFGLSAGRKRLFFKLRTLKNHALSGEERNLTDAEAKKLAHELKVSPASLRDMERLLSNPPLAFDAPLGKNGEVYGANFADTHANAEENLSEKQELSRKQELLQQAMDHLNPRERDIILNRNLQEKPLRLEDLAHRYGISRERVRQIENSALQKIIRWVKQQAPEMMCYA